MVDQEIFLYQSGDKLIEVVLTGRTAIKKRGRRNITLHEVKSVDDSIGFKHWLKLDQLFTIID